MINKLKRKLKSDVQLKELLSGSAITFIFKMTGMAMSFFLVYLISTKTGAQGVGFYNLAYQILIVLSMIICLGMNVSVLRYVGQFNNDNDRPKIRLLYNFLLRFSGGLAIIVGALIFFFAEVISDSLGKSADYKLVLQCVGLILPFYSINLVSIEFIRGLKKVHISEMLRSFLAPTIITLGILFYFTKTLTKVDIIYLLMIAILFNFAVAKITIWSKIRLIPLPSNNSKFTFQELLKTSFPMMLTGASASILTALPIFFLDYNSNLIGTGVFSVTFRLASIVSLVLVIINTITAPKFAELYYLNKLRELQQLVTRSAKIVLLFSFFISFILLMWSNELLSLFGEEFISGKISLIILVAGQLINASTGPVGIIMNMCGEHKTYTKITLIGLILSFILYYFIQSGDGLILYSILYTSIQISINVSCAIYIRKKMKISTFILTKFKTDR